MANDEEDIEDIDRVFGWLVGGARGASPVFVVVVVNA